MGIPALPSLVGYTPLRSAVLLLQASVLKLWSSDRTRVVEAQQLALALARVNSEGALGRYSAAGGHPSTLSVDSLRENFRGWSGQEPPDQQRPGQQQSAEAPQEQEVVMAH